MQLSVVFVSAMVPLAAAAPAMAPVATEGGWLHGLLKRSPNLVDVQFHPPKFVDGEFSLPKFTLPKLTYTPPTYTPGNVALPHLTTTDPANPNPGTTGLSNTALTQTTGLNHDQNSGNPALTGGVPPGSLNSLQVGTPPPATNAVTPPPATNAVTPPPATNPVTSPTI